MSACNFPACDRPASSRGLCSGHYQQRRRGVALTPLGDRPPCARCIDAAWLADAGETAERIAERMGITTDSLLSHLTRLHPNPGLVARLPRLVDVRTYR